MIRKISLIVALGLGAIVLASCGDDSDSGSSGSGDAAAFCTAFLELDGSTADMSDEEIVEEIEKLADIAPSEIRGDVEVVADGTATVVESGPDAVSDEETQRVDEAGTAVEAWVDDNCT